MVINLKMQLDFLFAVVDEANRRLKNSNPSGCCMYCGGEQVTKTEHKPCRFHELLEETGYGTQR